MMSSTSALLRLAVQRLMSCFIAILMVCFLHYDLSRFLLGHYIDTPRRAATSATGRPCSATCLTAATLNSSVNRALLINVSLRRYYEAKMCLVNLGRFIWLFTVWTIHFLGHG